MGQPEELNMCPKRMVTAGRKQGRHAPLRVQGEAKQGKEKFERAKLKMPGSGRRWRAQVHQQVTGVQGD